MATNAESHKQAVSWVAFDVDKIQEFVFASTRPIDVTGASELIKDLSKLRKLEEWLKDYNCDIVYSNGGSGLLKVHGDASVAQKVAQHLERKFREHTLTGSCTAVACQWVVNNAADFQRLLRVLGTKLQQRKREKAAEELPEPWVMPYFQRCQACGLYPAVSTRRIGNDPSEEPEYVCKSCDQKRERGKEAKNASNNEMMPRMAWTLEDIVGKEAGEEGARYLAVIYADANRAGHLLLQAENEQQVQAFSNWLWKVVEESVGETAQELGLEGKYQSPVVGGDDVLLFVPASRALEALKSIHEKLASKLSKVPSQLSSTELGTCLKDLSFSYALLIAPPHLPIPFLYQYAQALLKSSKQLAYQLRGPGDVIDFQWITESSPLSESLQDLQRAFHCKPQGGRRFLQDGKSFSIDEYWTTAKPYSWEEFNELLKVVRVFHSSKVTKGQLRRLAQLLQNPSPTEAQLNVLYQAVRNEEVTNALNQCCGSATEWPKFFFEVVQKNGKQVVQTKLLDILELFELQKLAEAAQPTGGGKP